MKILVVSNMYPAPEHPVGGIFVHEQVKALRRAGVDARVVTGKPLWLSGRRPRMTYARVRAEFETRRRGFAWSEHEGVPVFRFNYFAGAFAQPWNYPWIYRDAFLAFARELAADFPYELVHTHTAYLDGRAGAAAADLRAVPMLLTEHTGPFSLISADWRFRQHTRVGMARADRIVAVSEALRKEINLRLPEVSLDRITVVPNGVDTGFFRPDMADTAVVGEGAAANELDSWDAMIGIAKTDLVLSSFIIGLREGLRELGEEPVPARKFVEIIEQAVMTGIGLGPYTATLKLAGLPIAVDHTDAGDETTDEPDLPKIKILWVGHLVEVKRVDRLLDAFAIAHRRDRRLRLRLVGDGELRPALQARAIKLGIVPFVAFTPGQSRAGVRAEMAKADLLAIASETETFGIVGIEAMAMGLPVLATDCGGPADYLSSPAVGELVGNTTEDIAIGMQRIAARLDTFDRRLIRAHAVDHFDFERVADRLITHYRALLDAAPVRNSTLVAKEIST